MDPNFVVGYRYHPQAERWLPSASFLTFDLAVAHCYKMCDEQPDFTTFAIFKYADWHNGKPIVAPEWVLPSKI